MPKISSDRLLLLDTHVWLWFVFGTADLSQPRRKMISDATATGNLRLAAISLWETAVLAFGKRVNLQKPTVQWLDEAIVGSGIAVEPLNTAVAAGAYDLPGKFHRDPADRVIVATARISGAALMTRDRRILDYAGQGHVTAIPA